jgi:D-alanine--poly(phosphoribitol) ligase subunit 1
MQLLTDLQNSILKNSNRNAFYIENTFYTYSDLAQAISRIRNSIQLNIPDSEKNIGLITNNDLETYASIIALWLEGKAFIPLIPEGTWDHNQSKIDQANIGSVLDSSDKSLIEKLRIIETKKAPAATINLMPNKSSKSDWAYILFTSGTTGKPKGVPSTYDNLNGIIDAMEAMDFKIDENDKWLQNSELTFDVSIPSFLFPLLKGASVYTIPKGKIKYISVHELMDEQKLTVITLLPSMLNLLRPYFNEMLFPDIKYSLITAEPLPLELAIEWSKCAPKSKIINLYGPTENTVWSTYYTLDFANKIKTHNGIVSIGKSMKGTNTIIVDENNKLLPNGQKGELCLSGIQLTPGYLNNKEKNKESFFSIKQGKKEEQFYKTGDRCFVDEEGNIQYIGRIDFQTKIQGYRIELSEIEYHVKECLGKINVVALGIKNKVGNTELALVFESKEFSTAPLLDCLKQKIANYMIPKEIKFVDQFELNSNGKTDRKKLELLFNSN